MKTTAAFVTSVALGWLAFSGPASAGLINGDFSLGNTGFSSDYVHDPTPEAEQEYAIAYRPLQVHGGWGNFGDHTTGTGLMLIANGATQANKVVWSARLPTATDTAYHLSAWAATAYLPEATLRFTVNGSQVGDLLGLASVGEWRHFEAVWHSGANTIAEIAMYDVQQQWYGNDFVLDDLSFESASVPEPATLTMLLGVAAVGAARAVIRSRKARGMLVLSLWRRPS